ncbi:MAG: UDP-3-O-acyl-N-acetylglucosamine deacetylase [Nitrospirales bacterium]|nr:MAG: UDP-3-O-acyl-N-acetylglucosamine deacetylase [Nitrospirales bacterium]
MRFQQTIGKAISVSGVGLHSGEAAELTVHPAPSGTGIVFHKVTSGVPEACPATIQCLHPTDLCTALSFNTFQIQTVEHLLSALAGLEIDNVRLELTGNEIPALDGSSAPFVSLLLGAGIVEQTTLRTYLKIVRPITVERGNKSLSVYPAPLQKISYSIMYDHPLIKSQTYVHHASLPEFQRNIAPARTFAFKEEVEGLWSRGFGMGGSLDNTLVFSDTALMNETGLRFTDECVRHKILDLIGDLALLGLPVIGHFVADRAGHQLHAELVTAINANPDSWILINTDGEGNMTSVAKDADRNTQASTADQQHPVYSSF